MSSMHSFSKEQREAVRDLVHTVLLRDLSNFNPDRFLTWMKELDARFRKVAMTLRFRLNKRSVSFEIKEVKTGRTLYKFTSATHLPFDDKSIVMPQDPFVAKSW